MNIANIVVNQTTGVCTTRKRIPAGAVGLTVTVHFADPLWDRLEKTVVFRGRELEKIADRFDGTTAVIPAEVIAEPDTVLYFGIWGHEPEGILQLPLIEVRLGTTERATQPGSDPDADPTLPIWAQLQAEIEQLKQSGVSEEKIAQVVNDYLAKNPPSVTETDPTVPSWAKQPEKPSYTADEVGALSKGALSEAINAALAQAKESGEFDGPPGAPGRDYVLTEADKIDIAEMAADLVEIPDSGGNVDQSGVEPADDDIPKVYFTGTLPTSKDEGDLRLTMRYVSKTNNFAYPVTLKVQGSSSVNYPKKNFTLKPYKDSTYESKKKLAFKNWPEMNKFVLKAHWIDHSHVRNVGTAKIWGKIVESRSDYDSLPEELRNAPNNGATDGFTVKVFANGVYQGLYEWIVPKDKLFGQDSDIATHSIMNSESNSSATCAFATTSPTINGNWSEELQDKLSAEHSTSFANFIKFVAGASDTEFINNAENYFDVQSVIDFDILARVFCIVDNICRNQIFFTYDCVKWYEGCWDVDAILGMPPIVREIFPYNTEFQTGYIAYKDHRVTNMLYQRIENLFTDRFKARYFELRSGVLSIENILDVYERLTDTIVSHGNLLAEDVASTTADGAFTGIPFVTQNNIQQIRDFLAKRIPYMDEAVASITASYAPCTGITLSASSLTFTEEGSKTLTAIVTPESCTDTVRWVSNNPDVADVIDGVVTVKENGFAIITAYCGEYSASCSVSVSGIPVKIACTGITLDKSSMVFNGEGSQNIAATVTPADTTDEVVWSTSNMYIATVKNGVVTAQANGNVTIRATCGNHYAECAVSITGIDTMFKLSEETEFDGTSTYIDTGVQLYDTDKDYSVSMEYTPSGTNTSGKALLHCRHEDTSPLGMSVAIGYDGGSGKYVHRLYVNSQNIKHADALDHNNGSSDPGTWKWMGVSHNAAAKTYTTARYDGSNVYCDEITEDYYNITETMLLGCGQDKNGVKNNFWSGTIHELKVLNKANTVAEMFEHCRFHDMADSVVWSETAEYNLENNSHLTGVISGNVISGDRYVTHDRIAVPEGATKMAIYNMPNVTFTRFKIMEFGDTTGNALKENSTSDAVNNMVVTLQPVTKYVRLAARPLNPATNVTNTEPENNIGIMWM